MSSVSITLSPDDQNQGGLEYCLPAEMFGAHDQRPGRTHVISLRAVNIEIDEGRISLAGRDSHSHPVGNANSGANDAQITLRYIEGASIKSLTARPGEYKLNLPGLEYDLLRSSSPEANSRWVEHYSLRRPGVALECRNIQIDSQQPSERCIIRTMPQKNIVASISFNSALLAHWPSIESEFRKKLLEWQGSCVGTKGSRGKK